jgi:hypothetical protein
MENFGLVYTTELKESAIDKFRHITQVEFLKRAFRYEATLGKWVAPLRLESVLEIPQWTKKKMELEVLADNIKECAEELSLHEPSVYKEYLEKLNISVQTFIPDIILRDPILERRSVKLARRLNAVTFF